MARPDSAVTIEKYRQTQTGSGWHTAPDDGFLYEHLAYYLNEAELTSELHSLFNSDKWLHVRVVQCSYQYDGFVQDLDLAWYAAYQTWALQLRGGLRPAALTQCIRYALIRTSINSLNASYSPKLIARAVELGLWSPHRALSMARKIPDAHEKLTLIGDLLKVQALANSVQAEAIELGLSTLAGYKGNYPNDLVTPLASHLHGTDLDRALDILRMTNPPAERRKALAQLIPQTIDDQNRLRRIVEAYVEAGHEIFRSVGYSLGDLALSPLAPYMSGDLLQEVCEQALGHPIEEFGVIQLLAALLPQLEPLQRNQVMDRLLDYLRDTEKIRLGNVHEIIKRLAGHEREAILLQVHSLVLDALRGNRGERECSDAALMIEEYGGEQLNQILNQQLQEGNLWKQLKAAALLIRVNEQAGDQQAVLDQLIAQVAKQQDEGLIAWALRHTAPLLSGNMRAHALATALQVHDLSKRIECLAFLIPYLEPDIRKATLHTALSETLEAKYYQLVEWYLHPLIPDQDLPALVETILRIDESYWRNQLLGCLASRLAREQVSRALERSLSIPDVQAQSFALAALSPHLKPEQVNRALEILFGPNIRYSLDFYEALARWLPELDAEHFQHVLDRVLSVELTGNSLYCFARRLIEHLPDQDVERVFTRFATYQDEWAVIRGLEVLAPRLPSKLLQEALERAHQLTVGWGKMRLIGVLSLHLPSEQRRGILNQTLETIEALRDRRATEAQLKELAPYLDSEQFGRAFEIAKKLRYSGEFWIALASHVPADRASEFLGLALAQEHDIHRARMVGGIAHHLKGDTLHVALAAGREISNTFRSEYLASLIVPFSQEHSQQETLELVHSIEDDYHRSQGLVAILPFLDNEGLRQAYDIAARISSNDYHLSRTLINLLPYLSGKHAEQAADDVLNIQFSDSHWPLWHDNFWCTFIKHLPTSRVARAVEYAGALSSNVDRIRALVPLLSLTDNPGALEIMIRHNLSNHLLELEGMERASVLAFISDTLLYALPVLDEDILRDVADHVIEICQDWTWL